MKQIELTVLSRDADGVIEFLGRRALMHLREDESAETRAMNEAVYKHIRENLDKLKTASAWLEVPLPEEPEETSGFPGEAEEVLTDTITSAVSSLSREENEQVQEKRKIEEALNET
jgi:V/A-type H+-transporting ATPase subunit I